MIRTPILAAALILAASAAFAQQPDTPVTPPSYACAVPGQPFQSYSVTTSNGRDVYSGIAADCTGFSVSAPTGTPPCAVLGFACPITTIAPLDFMARLTPAEQTAITTAGQTNAQVMLFLLKLAGAQTVTTTDALTVAGVQAMVAAGLLTAPRAAQILNLAVPSP